jgi:hypothetical protein
VHNISILYISMMALGNLTYTISVLLRSVEPAYVWKQAPFLLGVLGPMVCDIILLFQKWIYSTTESDSTGDKEAKEDGRDISELSARDSQC